MEFTPKETLTVPQKVIPIKGVSNSEYTQFLMVARDDLVELIEVKIG